MQAPQKVATKQRKWASLNPGPAMAEAPAEELPDLGRTLFFCSAWSTSPFSHCLLWHIASYVRTQRAHVHVHTSLIPIAISLYLCADICSYGCTQLHRLLHPPVQSHMHICTAQTQHVSIYPCICLSIYLSIGQPACQSLCSICLFIRKCTHPSINPATAYPDDPYA